MKFSPHYLRRYKDIAVLFAKHGQPRLASRFNFDGEAVAVNGHKRNRIQELPDDLERLGPTFVKLGQILSSRADLLPEPYLRALSRLQDRVKPFPYNEAEAIIESELGTDIATLFATISREPIASASLGQVYRATLRDGRVVAVKVQRPNIYQQIEDDFAALEEIAGFLHRNTAFGQRYRLEDILQEFETTIAHELDYRREAANMQTLSEALKEFPRIRIPLPVENFSTRRVLTMDYIEGTKITEIGPRMRAKLDESLADEVFRAYLKQVLVIGTFHADPHPGNVQVTRDGAIALLDLGMVGHITPSMREHILKLLLAVSENESDEAADMAIRISGTSDNFDEMQFRHRIGQLIADQCNSTLREMVFGRVLLELGRTAGETGLYVPMELTLLGKTLLQLDQIGQIVAPDFDPNESVRRNASRILDDRMKSVFSEGKIFSSLLEAKQFFGALPTRLNKILDAVGNAELHVKVRPLETRFILDSFQKVANRITMGLILSALIVGAALLMQVKTSFHIFGYPGIAILCFLAAAGGGITLVLNILWKDHKSKRGNLK